ncbi:ABC-2 type transport system permease protein [Halogranum rubrum]|uniref:ABC-2 type transport system permease protein n=2 Tax=Halogranum rubrum TaxID=553466 RepID=A0A1I4EV07_9EURY|nr:MULTISPECIES: ABC transporter permease [Halogranum]EJN60225.1 multidrug ABC transporter permease [Halogranum salarium B-1]SFL08950.1 ABC-2 type transport system permease protein [Halogranum rubrum]
MSRLKRITSTTRAGWHSFLRRRTAVFFTFFFPVIIVAIFAGLVQTQPTGGGIFAEPPAYYIPGYLAVVVLFTPLSRVGSEIARHRDGNQFEKLATTPLKRWEWLLAQTLVNVVVIGLAGLLLLGLTVVVTGVSVPLEPATLLLIPFVAVGVALFCGIGALLGNFADSQDGVVAASNAIALPLLFLSETFVTPDLLPSWFRPLVGLSPLTYFARGVRGLTYSGDAIGAVVTNLAILSVLALVFFAAGAVTIPRTD